MTQEEKELLIKELCARLSYGVKVRYSSYIEFITCTLHSINPIYNIVDLWSKDACFVSVNISKIKPYLFPLSSMTEEEREEFRVVGGVMSHNVQNDSWAISAFTPEAYDWLNAHHFDFRGLIPMGLALEATEGMYKTE